MGKRSFCHGLKHRHVHHVVVADALDQLALIFDQTVCREHTQKSVVLATQTREDPYDFIGYHAYEDKLDAFFTGGRKDRSRMSESPSNLDETSRTANLRMVRWDAVAATIASLIGLFALIVGGYTAYIQREQVRAQVWPFLLARYSGNASEFLWINKGVGPAMIESVQVFVDGKPQHDWNGVIHAFHLCTMKYQQSTLNGYVFPPGEQLVWIKFNNNTDFTRFLAAQRTGLVSKVCYCSTLGECWILDRGRGTENSRTPVGDCPAVPESRQFDD
ncbi:MAG: hypothetical protein ACRESE_07475 [Gammaproteobacteria bacterium]